MAKIGGGTSSEPVSETGSELPGSGVLGTPPPGKDRGVDKSAPGTLFWVMSRLESFLEERHPDFGIGYSGAFNSETATVEIRGALFDVCARSDGTDGHYIELTADCEECGRKPGNNIRLLTGSGDGTYSGINYWAARSYDGDHNINPELIASLYLFDQGSAHSRGNDARGWDSPMQFFFENAARYQELKGSIVGDFTAGVEGFWVGDFGASDGSSHAMVNHWGSESRSYRVIVFSERVETKEGWGDFPGQVAPVRPRIILILGQQVATDLFEAGIDFESIDWEAQPRMWLHLPVQANIGGGHNGVACLNNDGIYWEKVWRGFQGSSPALKRKYETEVFGRWFQAALVGNEKARNYLSRFLREEGVLPFTNEEVTAALRRRGWPLNTPLSAELVMKLGQRIHRDTGGQ